MDYEIQTFKSRKRHKSLLIYSGYKLMKVNRSVVQTTQRCVLSDLVWISYVEQYCFKSL